MFDLLDRLAAERRPENTRVAFPWRVIENSLCGVECGLLLLALSGVAGRPYAGGMNIREQSTTESPTWLRPWRLEWPAWLLSFVFLIVGLPLFYRMPPWCDLTLYDLAARAIMTGGVHYRDVFDTNLPGFVWSLTGIRRAFGSSTEVVRVVDLAIVMVCCLLLAWLAIRAGADRRSIAWFAAGASVFYPFTTEFCHAQRDVWMLLPALLALSIRLRQSRSRPWVFGVAEGLLWGMAVWFKPHAIFPALGAWLATNRRDFRANLLGGTLAGAAGVAWLLTTDTWPYFVEVFTKWNPHYTEYLFVEMGWRAVSHWFHFAPWTYLQPLIVLLILADLCRHRRWVARLPQWLYVAAPDERTAAVRSALGAFYLAWLLQSYLLQRQFPYVHVPGTLIVFALFAAHRWAIVPFGLVFLLLSSLIAYSCEHTPAWKARAERIEQSFPWLWLAIPRHPLTDPARLALWTECWKPLDPAESRRRQDRLASYPGYFAAISIDESHETAEWLRTHGATADTVIAWHSSPHAVYLGLSGTPAFRFMHVDTPLIRKATYEFMKDELIRVALPRAKYVVSDLSRTFVASPPERMYDWNRPGIDLPEIASTAFPYNQPVVFRSGNGRGRYVVHEVRTPVTITEYDLPYGNIWGRE